MKILIFGLGGVFGASRREHVEHVEHMNGIIDEDQTKELRVSTWPGLKDLVRFSWTTLSKIVIDN